MKYGIRYEGRDWYAGTTDEGVCFTPDPGEARSFPTEIAAESEADQLAAEIFQARTKFRAEQIPSRKRRGGLLP